MPMKRLLQVIGKMDADIDLREWVVDRSENREEYRGYGAPAILIAGDDLEGRSQKSDDRNCRVYICEDGSISKFFFRKRRCCL
jgi:hypothetical protein